MIEWPRTIRFDRIADATNALSKSGTRWQKAAQLDPQTFRRVQGLQTGQPVLRVGIGPELTDAWRNLFRAAAGRAALRALPYIPSGKRENVTLNDWSDGISLGPARWGGAYKAFSPSEPLAAPVDGSIWKSIREDPVYGKPGWTLIDGQIRKIRATAKEPLPELLAVSLVWQGESIPEAWTEAGMHAIPVLLREFVSQFWQNILGGGPAATIMGETLASSIRVNMMLPEAVQSRIAEEARQWKGRATPPVEALDDWTAWIQDVVDDDGLEMAWAAELKDQASRALLLGMQAAENTIEPSEKELWVHHAGSVTGLPLFEALSKVDPSAHNEVSERLKEESKRFKGKVRRKTGAQFMAKLALLHAFDDWSAEFLQNSFNLLERGPDDEARITEESERGGLYAFMVGDSSGAMQDDIQVFSTGHLFADLKGFTALTAQLKEVEIRQFLRQNFYGPLLEIAKSFFKGGIDLADRGGIRLNNLMGDAISLCGDVVDLVGFAEKATALVQDEIGEILKKNMGGGDAELQAEVEQANLELHELKIELARAGDDDAPDLELRIQELQSKIELADRATGMGAVELDFGFFVSFGPSPVDLEFQDDIFGRVYVALAEKINESARGVERDGDVLAALQAFEKRFPDRPWAFRIHVGPKIGGEWPEELLDAWPTDPEEAGAVAMAVPGAVRFSGGTSMYNTGIGLSPESVSTLLKSGEVNQVKFWSGKTPELIQRLSARFLMPEPGQTFLLVPWKDGETRILRRCGKVQMKGFKRPPTVWEWVGPWMDVHKSLSGFLDTNGEELSWTIALQRAG